MAIGKKGRLSAGINCEKIASALEKLDLNDEVKYAILCEAIASPPRKLTDNCPIVNSIAAGKNPDCITTTRETSIRPLTIVIAIVAIVYATASFSPNDDNGGGSLGWKVTQVFFRWWHGVGDFEEESCAIEVPRALQDAFLPPFNCSLCETLVTVPKVANISQDEFSNK